MSGDFVHLSVHTQFSISDSVVRIPDLMSRVGKDSMAAVALTDRSNLFALVKFYRQALRQGVKPVIGADVTVRGEDGEGSSRLILLCRDINGYRNLTRLISRAYLEGQDDDTPEVKRDWLTPDTASGLAALSGGIDGDIGRLLLTEKTEAARERLAYWQRVFCDQFFLELTRIGREGENHYIEQAVNLAHASGCPLVATNDVRFLDESDFNAHEARVCIHQGRALADPKRPRHYTRQQYLKSPLEMRELFADLPEAIDNTVALATQLNLDIELGKSFLPRFPLADESTEESYLESLARSGLAELLDGGLESGIDADIYHARLQRELDVIIEMGFAGYFLIVADFIQWAKDNQIPVGPGRGSGAGSLVAWVLGITDIDPLQYDLLFERFLNPERVSMPDFDIDFCMEGRDRVIEYVAERYGRERVSQIITYGTMAAKAVVRDAGRVLGQPYGFVDRIAKLIPFEVGMTLDKAVDAEAELAALIESDADVGTIFELARSLEGLARNAGKHAGGVVIAPTELTDFAPLYCEPGGANVVTQFDKDDVEAAGLVKFDFLGLRTLTVIDWAVETINRNGPSSRPPLDVGRIPLDDAATYKLLQAAQTTAVFQLESRGMKDLIKRLRPDQFEDLIALVALYRPGPLQSGMVDDFIQRKHQGAGTPIDYLHPDLTPALESTYGVILYQEQVMQIAQVLAGYTLGGADLLRRAMGKKKAEEMAKQREIFLEGADKRGVPKGQAEHIFDLMEKFAGYGFNKSHSAAYALLSYQTAWLKAHHPAAFMAAVMSADIDNTDKLVVLKADCRDIGVEVLPPDVNQSDYRFGITGNQAIRYGLGAVKGVGRNVIEALVAERRENGEYSALGEICQRLGGERVNRRAFESLIKAGALDCIEPNRRRLLAGLPDALKSTEQSRKAIAAGQNDMFGLDEAASPADTVPLPDIEPWSTLERLQAEKESLGLYLSGHPFATVRPEAQYFTTSGLGQLAQTPAPNQNGGERSFSRKGVPVTVAGLIMDVRKRGNRVSFVLDDDTAQMEASLFSEAFMNFKHLLVKDAIVVVTGTLRYDEFMNGWQISAKRLEPVDRVIEERAQEMVLRVAPNGKGEQLLYQLHDALAPHRSGGQCSVSLHYLGEQAKARVQLGNEWQVHPTRKLREQLEALLGEASVRLVFAARH